MPLDHLKRPNPKQPEPAKPIDRPAPSKAAAPKATPPPKPSVAYRCGHKVAVAHFESIDCPGCRAGQRRTKNAARRMRPAKPWPNRLPAGSVKLIEWTGEAWTGTLTVPAVQGLPAFEATCKAATEREACHDLHARFVEWLERSTT